MVSYRADVKWQDEDDEEAEVPGQQRSQQDHPLLPPQVSIALEEVEGQEENNYNYNSQRSTTHSDESTDRHQELIIIHWRGKEINRDKLIGYKLLSVGQKGETV